MTGGDDGTDDDDNDYSCTKYRISEEKRNIYVQSTVCYVVF